MVQVKFSPAVVSFIEWMGVTSLYITIRANLFPLLAGLR